MVCGRKKKFVPSSEFRFVMIREGKGSSPGIEPGFTRCGGGTDGRAGVQIPPVFYRILSPPVPSGAAALLT